MNLTFYNKLSREPLYFCLLKHKQVSGSSACPIHSATREPALLRCVQSDLHFKIVTSISRKRSHHCDMYLPKNSRVEVTKQGLALSDQCKNPRADA